MHFFPHEKSQKHNNELAGHGSEWMPLLDHLATNDPMLEKRLCCVNNEMDFCIGRL